MKIEKIVKLDNGDIDNITSIIKSKLSECYYEDGSTQIDFEYEGYEMTADISINIELLAIDGDNTTPEITVPSNTFSFINIFVYDDGNELGISEPLPENYDKIINI